MPSKRDAREPLNFFLAMRYPVRLTPEAEGGLTAEVPDLPGCLSQGETTEEALLHIQEARASRFTDPVGGYMRVTAWNNMSDGNMDQRANREVW
jgi:hypothetical protein